MIKRIAYQIAEKNKKFYVDGSDLEQEIWIKLILSLHKFDPEKGNLIGFIFKVAENHARDYMRKFRSDAKKKYDYAYKIDPDKPEDKGREWEHDLKLFEHALSGIPEYLKKTPEQIAIENENCGEVKNAFDKIDKMDRHYLKYRYGFDDYMPHDANVSADHFYLEKKFADRIERRGMKKLKKILVPPRNEKTRYWKKTEMDFHVSCWLNTNEKNMNSIS